MELKNVLTAFGITLFVLSGPPKGYLTVPRRDASRYDVELT